MQASISAGSCRPLSPAVGKGVWNAVADTSCKKAFVVYPGSETYSVGNSVVALPVKNLAKIWM